MKKFKTFVSVILAVMAISAISACASATGNISVDNAKEIALTHAGIAAADAVFTQAELDYDDGMKIYEIEFYSGVTEYDYEINAETGVIISFDSEYDDDRQEAPATNPSNPPSSASYISADAAKQAALDHAGVAAADATFLKAELDHDDGRAEYDVDFYSGNYEYDYEINAVTGAVISWDKEIEYYTPTPTTAPSEGVSGASTALDAAAEQISVDRAKEIALEHAGKSASEVKFTKAKLDRDDGKYHYDIEFKIGATEEYDYEIDAVSGAVIEFDYDYDPIPTGSFFSFFRNFFNWIFGR